MSTSVKNMPQFNLSSSIVTPVCYRGLGVLQSSVPSQNISLDTLLSRHASPAYHELLDKIARADAILETTTASGVSDAEVDELMSDINPFISHTSSQVTPPPAVESRRGLMFGDGLNVTFARQHPGHIAIVCNRGKYLFVADAVPASKALTAAQQDRLLHAIQTNRDTDVPGVLAVHTGSATITDVAFISFTGPAVVIHDGDHGPAQVSLAAPGAAVLERQYTRLLVLLSDGALLVWEWAAHCHQWMHVTRATLPLPAVLAHALEEANATSTRRAGDLLRVMAVLARQHEHLCLEAAADECLREVQHTLGVERRKGGEKGGKRARKRGVVDEQWLDAPPERTDLECVWSALPRPRVPQWRWQRNVSMLRPVYVAQPQLFVQPPQPSEAAGAGAQVASAGDAVVTDTPTATPSSTSASTANSTPDSATACGELDLCIGGAALALLWREDGQLRREDASCAEAAEAEVVGALARLEQGAGLGVVEGGCRWDNLLGLRLGELTKPLVDAQLGVTAAITHAYVSAHAGPWISSFYPSRRSLFAALLALYTPLHPPAAPTASLCAALAPMLASPALTVLCVQRDVSLAAHAFFQPAAPRARDTSKTGRPGSPHSARSRRSAARSPSRSDSPTLRAGHGPFPSGHGARGTASAPPAHAALYGHTSATPRDYPQPTGAAADTWDARGPSLASRAREASSTYGPRVASTGPHAYPYALTQQPAKPRETLAHPLAHTPHARTVAENVVRSIPCPSPFALPAGAEVSSLAPALVFDTAITVDLPRAHNLHAMPVSEFVHALAEGSLSCSATPTPATDAQQYIGAPISAHTQPCASASTPFASPALPLLLDPSASASLLAFATWLHARDKQSPRAPSAVTTNPFTGSAGASTASTPSPVSASSSTGADHVVYSLSSSASTFALPDRRSSVTDLDTPPAAASTLAPESAALLHSLALRHVLAALADQAPRAAAKHARSPEADAPRPLGGFTVLSVDHHAYAHAQDGTHVHLADNDSDDAQSALLAALSRLSQGSHFHATLSLGSTAEPTPTSLPGDIHAYTPVSTHEPLVRDAHVFGVPARVSLQDPSVLSAEDLARNMRRREVAVVYGRPSVEVVEPTHVWECARGLVLVAKHSLPRSITVRTHTVTVRVRVDERTYALPVHFTLTGETPALAHNTLRYLPVSSLFRALLGHGALVAAEAEENALEALAAAGTTEVLAADATTESSVIAASGTAGLERLRAAATRRTVAAVVRGGGVWRWWPCLPAEANTDAESDCDDGGGVTACVSAEALLAVETIPVPVRDVLAESSAQDANVQAAWTFCTTPSLSEHTAWERLSVLTATAAARLRATAAILSAQGDEDGPREGDMEQPCMSLTAACETASDSFATSTMLLAAAARVCVQEGDGDVLQLQLSARDGAFCRKAAHTAPLSPTLSTLLDAPLSALTPLPHHAHHALPPVLATVPRRTLLDVAGAGGVFDAQLHAIAAQLPHPDLLLAPTASSQHAASTPIGIPAECPAPARVPLLELRTGRALTDTLAALAGDQAQAHVLRSVPTSAPARGEPRRCPVWETLAPHVPETPLDATLALRGLRFCRADPFSGPAGQPMLLCGGVVVALDEVEPAPPTAAQLCAPVVCVTDSVAVPMRFSAIDANTRSHVGACASTGAPEPEVLLWAVSRAQACPQCGAEAHQADGALFCPACAPDAHTVALPLTVRAWLLPRPALPRARVVRRLGVPLVRVETARWAPELLPPTSPAAAHYDAGGGSAVHGGSARWEVCDGADGPHGEDVVFDGTTDSPFLLAATAATATAAHPSSLSLSPTLKPVDRRPALASDSRHSYTASLRLASPAPCLVPLPSLPLDPSAVGPALVLAHKHTLTVVAPIAHADLLPGLPAFVHRWWYHAIAAALALPQTMQAAALARLLAHTHSRLQAQSALSRAALTLQLTAAVRRSLAAVASPRVFLPLPALASLTGLSRVALAMRTYSLATGALLETSFMLPRAGAAVNDVVRFSGCPVAPAARRWVPMGVQLPPPTSAFSCGLQPTQPVSLSVSLTARTPSLVLHFNPSHTALVARTTTDNTPAYVHYRPYRVPRPTTLITVLVDRCGCLFFRPPAPPVLAALTAEHAAAATTHAVTVPCTDTPSYASPHAFPHVTAAASAMAAAHPAQPLARALTVATLLHSLLPLRARSVLAHALAHALAPAAAARANPEQLLSAPRVRALLRVRIAGDLSLQRAQLAPTLGENIRLAGVSLPRGLLQAVALWPTHTIATLLADPRLHALARRVLFVFASLVLGRSHGRQASRAETSLLTTLAPLMRFTRVLARAARHLSDAAMLAAHPLHAYSAFSLTPRRALPHRKPVWDVRVTHTQTAVTADVLPALAFASTHTPATPSPLTPLAEALALSLTVPHTPPRLLSVLTQLCRVFAQKRLPLPAHSLSAALSSLSTSLSRLLTHARIHANAEDALGHSVPPLLHALAAVDVCAAGNGTLALCDLLGLPLPHLAPTAAHVQWSAQYPLAPHLGVPAYPSLALALPSVLRMLPDKPITQPTVAAIAPDPTLASPLVPPAGPRALALARYCARRAPVFTVLVSALYRRHPHLLLLAARIVSESLDAAADPHPIPLTTLPSQPPPPHMVATALFRRAEPVQVIARQRYRPGASSPFAPATCTLLHAFPSTPTFSALSAALEQYVAAREDVRAVLAQCPVPLAWAQMQWGMVPPVDAEDTCARQLWHLTQEKEKRREVWRARRAIAGELEDLSEEAEEEAWLTSVDAHRVNEAMVREERKVSICTYSRTLHALAPLLPAPDSLDRLFRALAQADAQRVVAEEAPLDPQTLLQLLRQVSAAAASLHTLLATATVFGDAAASTGHPLASLRARIAATTEGKLSLSVQRVVALADLHVARGDLVGALDEHVVALHGAAGALQSVAAEIPDARAALERCLAEDAAAATPIACDPLLAAVDRCAALLLQVCMLGDVAKHQSKLALALASWTRSWTTPLTALDAANHALACARQALLQTIQEAGAQLTDQCYDAEVEAKSDTRFRSALAEPPSTALRMDVSMLHDVPAMEYATRLSQSRARGASVWDESMMRTTSFSVGLALRPSLSQSSVASDSSDQGDNGPAKPISTPTSPQPLSRRSVTGNAYISTATPSSRRTRSHTLSTPALTQVSEVDDDEEEGELVCGGAPVHVFVTQREAVKHILDLLPVDVVGLDGEDEAEPWYSFTLPPDTQAEFDSVHTHMCARLLALSVRYGLYRADTHAENGEASDDGAVRGKVIPELYSLCERDPDALALMEAYGLE